MTRSSSGRFAQALERSNSDSYRQATFQSDGSVRSEGIRARCSESASTPRTSATSGESRHGLTRTSSSEASPASRSALPEGARVLGMNDGYGPRFWEPFARYDRRTRSWRMYKGCCLPGMGAPSDEFAETWPKSGMIANGIAYRPRSSELLTYGIDSSLWPTPCATEYGRNRSRSAGAAIRPSLGTMASKGLLPTPTATDARGRGYQICGAKRDRENLTLAGVARLLPTPRASDANGAGRHGDGGADLRTAIRYSDLLRGAGDGRLNPLAVEYMMGLPPGWTQIPAGSTVPRHTPSTGWKYRRMASRCGWRRRKMSRIVAKGSRASETPLSCRSRGTSGNAYGWITSSAWRRIE